MTNYNHSYTLAPYIGKSRKDIDGKRIRVTLTHGWNRAGDGARCCENLHFTTQKQAIAYANERKWNINNPR